MALLKEKTAIIHGSVEPGFEEVERVFRSNFMEFDELGSACAAYVQGKKVVDLWGGYRDTSATLPWEEDTSVLVFSTTKGIAALTMAYAHSRGLFDYDEKMASYWPEFAQYRKDKITVRQLLSHQAGLCAIDEELTVGLLADTKALDALLARQKPAWEPGTQHGYHAFSLGWYESALLRCVDPHHRSIGQYFQEELARPLGLTFYIGLPPDVPGNKIAPIKAFNQFEMLFHMNTLSWKMVTAYMNPCSLTSRTLHNPRVSSPGAFDLPEFRAVEFPSGGGIGNARSIARLYGIFAMGGQELAITQATLDALIHPAPMPTQGYTDLVLKEEMFYSLGFMKPSSLFQFGSSTRAFGSAGAGGSIGFADPDTQVGFAYTPNRMGFYLSNDPREKALQDALFRCLKQRETH